jgi:hypothetical protein
MLDIVLNADVASNCVTAVLEIVVGSSTKNCPCALLSYHYLMANIKVCLPSWVLAPKNGIRKRYT